MEQKRGRKVQEAVVKFEQGGKFSMAMVGGYLCEQGKKCWDFSPLSLPPPPPLSLSRLPRLLVMNEIKRAVENSEVKDSTT